MKSFNLTNALREVIVSGLVNKATKVEREAITKIYREICKTYWKEHRDGWQTLSGLTTKQVDNLLENRMIGGQTCERVTIPCEQGDGQLADEAHKPMITYWGRGNTVRVEVKSDTLQPSFHAQDFKPSKEVIERLTTLFQQVVELGRQTRELRSDLRTVTNSCRTSKQLMEVLPQAESYLNKGGATGKALLDTNLINDVQERLKTGVPA